MKQGASSDRTEAGRILSTGVAATAGGRKGRRRRGSEALEFTLVLLPMMAMISVLVDMSWAVFAESTLQYAVRYAAHTGVTLSSAQLAPGACLTDTVKTLVQQSAIGLVSGSSGRALIKVNYLQPPAVGTSGSSTDVSTQSDGDAPGNIMQVSVQGFSLIPLLPRFSSWSSAPDKSATAISVYSADIIESAGGGGDTPCIGTAP